MTDNKKPTREEAEAAVRTMLAWTGDNPDREGLVETPKRVVRAYEQFFAGYEMDPKEVLSKVFEEVEGYDEMVIVKDIRVESHCEHHILARVVDIFGKRLQTQEVMTAQIANVINEVLEPKGVAVVMNAKHQCMTTRGVHKPESSTITSTMLGAFRENPDTRAEFMNLITTSS